MNANTRRRLWKETRVLLPMWAVAVGLMLAPRMLMDWNPLDFSVPAYWLACVCLSAASFGHDFQLRTMGLMLTQPVSRRRIWWEKHLVLGIGLFSLLGLILALWFTDRQIILHPNHEDWGWLITFETIPFFYAAILGFTTGPAFTLLTRTFHGGATLTLVCPWLLFLLSWLLLPRSQVAYRGSVLAVFNVTFMGALYCGLLFLLGCRLFQRFEDMDSTKQDFAAPAQFNNLFAQLTAGLAPGRDSLTANLLRKELRLQHPAFFVAAFLVALWAACVGVWRARPTMGGEIMLIPVIFLCLAIPVMVGIVSTAEERRLGVHEWHLTLPVSARRLWTVKVLVALGVNALLGLLLPGLLAHASSWLADNPQLVAEIRGRNVSPLIIANLVIVGAAIFASTVAANPMRALIGTVALFIAVPVAYGLVEWCIGSRGIGIPWLAWNTGWYLVSEAHGLVDLFPLHTFWLAAVTICLLSLQVAAAKLLVQQAWQYPLGNFRWRADTVLVSVRQVAAVAGLVIGLLLTSYGLVEGVEFLWRMPR